MTVILTLIAQVILALRFALFCNDNLVLIVGKWNRIYAITGKNRIVTSCLGVMTISQFSLGLYMAAYAAKRGCEFTTNCAQNLLPMSMFQRDRHRSHFWPL